MKKFKLENLPKKVRDRIQDITFEDDLRDGCIGIVNLKDGYIFCGDNSHVEAFRSRKDLIDMVGYSVEEELREYKFFQKVCEDIGKTTIEELKKYEIH